MADSLASVLACIEDASLNASAPGEQRWFDGWLVRYATGAAKRARCVNAVAAGRLRLADKLVRCEQLYSAASLPFVFRITPFTLPLSLDAELEGLGWQSFDTTVVMWRQLAAQALPGRALDGLHWATPDVAAFAAIAGTIKGSEHADVLAHAERLRSSPVEHRSVVLQRGSDGEPVACGQVALECDIAGLYDIHVHAAHRRRGFGGLLCEQLLSAAATAGAGTAYLQVEADNLAARRLYSSLGFMDGYAYHYRCPPVKR